MEESSDKVDVVTDLKRSVREFWDNRPCGEAYAKGDTQEEHLQTHATTRYRLEPYIRPFAKFDGTGRNVLEIGVGMGADHVEWAKSGPRQLVGVDLSPRAVDWTLQRLAYEGAESNVLVGDAESLPFREATFDLVYSWGVLHHTPDTRSAFGEAHRVLRAGGQLRAMIYHRPSVVGLLLWARYGLGKCQPRRSLSDLYAQYLESPGTKGFTSDEASELLSGFDNCRIRSIVSFGDLLEGVVGQQHHVLGAGLLRRLWPRAIVRRLPCLGLILLLEATKPQRPPRE